MGTDLYTNLILNDTRFRDGFERATRTTDSAMGRITKTMGMARKGLALGGLLMFVDAGVDAWDKINERQARAVAGLSTYRDEWEKMHQGWALLGSFPILGDTAQKIGWNLTGGAMGQVQWDAAKAMKAKAEAMEEEIELLRARTPEEREAIRLLQEHKHEVQELAQINKATEADDSRQIATARIKLRLKQEDLALAKLKAEWEKGANRGRSRLSFDDSIEQDDIAMMRARGEDAAADRLSIEAETRRRIRELGNDDTLPGGPNAERTRRLEEIYRIRQEKLDAIKPAAPDYGQSAFGAGGSTTLGQIFGPGMSTSTFAKQAASAEKIARESAEQTKLLKSIDAGIRHSGTRYAS